MSDDVMKQAESVPTREEFSKAVSAFAGPYGQSRAPLLAMYDALVAALQQERERAEQWRARCLVERCDCTDLATCQQALREAVVKAVDETFRACWRAEGFDQEPWDWGVPRKRIAEDVIDGTNILDTPTRACKYGEHD